MYQNFKFMLMYIYNDMYMYILHVLHACSSFVFCWRCTRVHTLYMAKYIHTAGPTMCFLHVCTCSVLYTLSVYIVLLLLCLCIHVCTFGCSISMVMYIVYVHVYMYMRSCRLSTQVTSAYILYKTQFSDFSYT